MHRTFIALCFSLLLAGCASAEPGPLRLATTTSTYDSGLLDAILPAFTAETGAAVEVVAVGTGQALTLGEAGDADVILVHAREREEAFIAAGHGTRRYDVMFNDFVIVGPAGDPAAIRGLALAHEAFSAIAAAGATFASRGDDSGTHIKERELWAAAGLDPDPEGGWYKSLGQGMGNTLIFSDEVGAYALADRGTFLAMREKLPGLELLLGGADISENVDPALLNPYGLIPVNPDKGGIDYDLAQAFADWFTGLEVQQAIAEYGLEEFGQPLFYPDSDAWRAAAP